MEAGIVPVKALGRAKQRLADRFDALQRVELASAMLDDTIDLCSSVTAITWFFVSDDDEVLERAAAAGFGPIKDDGTGLNEALALALDEVAGRGMDSVLILPCDLPLARAGDIQDLVDTGATSDVVLVPSHDGGTNAMLMSMPLVMSPRFGPGSLKEHLGSAEALRIRCALLALPRLALDIDTPDDVDAFLTRGVKGTNLYEKLVALEATT